MTLVVFRFNHRTVSSDTKSLIDLPSIKILIGSFFIDPSKYSRSQLKLFSIVLIATTFDVSPEFWLYVPSPVTPSTEESLDSGVGVLFSLVVLPVFTKLHLFPLLGLQALVQPLRLFSFFFVDNV